MPTIPQGTLDLLILQALSRKSMHGYAIARWIEAIRAGAFTMHDDGLGFTVEGE